MKSTCLDILKKNGAIKNASKNGESQPWAPAEAGALGMIFFPIMGSIKGRKGSSPIAWCNIK